MSCHFCIRATRLSLWFLSNYNFTRRQLQPLFSQHCSQLRRYNLLQICHSRPIPGAVVGSSPFFLSNTTQRLTRTTCFVLVCQHSPLLSRSSTTTMSSRKLFALSKTTLSYEYICLHSARSYLTAHRPSTTTSKYGTRYRSPATSWK